MTTSSNKAKSSGVAWCILYLAVWLKRHWFSLAKNYRFFDLSRLTCFSVKYYFFSKKSTQLIIVSRKNASHPTLKITMKMRFWSYILTTFLLSRLYYSIRSLALAALTSITISSSCMTLVLRASTQKLFGTRRWPW